MEKIVVRKGRWPDRLAVTIDAGILDHDECGTWLHLPQLVPYLDGAGIPGFIQPVDAVGVFTEGERWISWFWPRQWKVDICMPVTAGPGVVEFCDLELDVVRHGDGPAEIVDVDEFEELELPADMARRTMDDARRVAAMITEKQAPYDDTARERVASVWKGTEDHILERAWIGPAWPHGVDVFAEMFGHQLVNDWWRDHQAGEGLLVLGGASLDQLVASWHPFGGEPRVVLQTENMAGSTLPDVLLDASRVAVSCWPIATVAARESVDSA